MSDVTVNENSGSTVNESKVSISDRILEHEKFDHISDSKFMTSNELCTVISELFRNIYAQFEGCVYEILPGTNQPTISLFFNHRMVAPDNTLPFAISKDSTDTKTVNSTLRSTRSFSNRMINGDRYFITDDGMDLAEFIIDNNQFYKDGKVIWKKLISEVADGNYSPIAQQYTKISCLDPAKIVAAVYGKKDDDDTEWVYGVRTLRSIPTYSMAGNVGSAGFMVAVERVSKNEVEKLANKFGLNINAGLNIIR